MGTGSDKENESNSQTLEQVESEPLNGKITNKSLKGRKQSNSEQESVDEPTKRTLRSKAGESKKIENFPAEKDKTEPDSDELGTDSSSEDLRKRSLRSSTESQQETGSDVESSKEDDVTVDKKRKAVEDADQEMPAKRLHIVDETLGPADTEGENNNSAPAAKKKMLGPKSKRKPIEETGEKPLRKKLLGPKSKRKSYVPDEENDSSEEQQIDEITKMLFRKKKPPKCNINMTSLFQKSLCKAACGHCDEVGGYQIHLVDFDLDRELVSMECTACKWTTVRKMTLTTKVLG